MQLILKSLDSNPLTNDNTCISIKFESGAIANIIYTSEGSSLVSKEYVEVYSNGLTAVIDDFKKLNIYKEDKRIVSSLSPPKIRAKLLCLIHGLMR